MVPVLGVVPRDRRKEKDKGRTPPGPAGRVRPLAMKPVPPGEPPQPPDEQARGISRG